LTNPSSSDEPHKGHSRHTGKPHQQKYSWITPCSLVDFSPVSGHGPKIHKGLADRISRCVEASIQLGLRRGRRFCSSRQKATH
jgi:hypothetical protein